ncbi:MAG TPA: hypothetical protein VK745_07155 [Polyangiaceae bacterium]|nr:hypothetical protein [Polyangiaceae bacterium]
MKSPLPDSERLDQLADGLDAGWDTEADPPVSLNPHSAPLPAALAELDAEWDVAVPAKSPAPAPAQPRPAQARPSAVRPSPARPSQTRAITQPLPAGASPVHASKRERRDAERKRRAHEAEQKSASKKQRKAARREEARLASERTRLAEERAQSERRAREEANLAGKRAQAPTSKKADGERQKSPKRVPKRVRHEHVRSARSSATDEVVEKSKPAPVVPLERGAKKLIVPLLIAILVAVTLGFALSRAR